MFLLSIPKPISIIIFLRQGLIKDQRVYSTPHDFKVRPALVHYLKQEHVQSAHFLWNLHPLIRPKSANSVTDFGLWWTYVNFTRGELTEHVPISSNARVPYRLKRLPPGNNNKAFVPYERLKIARQIRATDDQFEQVLHCQDRMSRSKKRKRKLVCCNLCNNYLACSSVRQMVFRNARE